MKTNKYVIRCERKAELGFVTETLCVDKTWALATNSAMKFRTKHEASNYWRKTCDIPLRTCLWIEGPKGGSYRINIASR